MIHCANSYNVPNLRVRGWVCRTNLPSNTGFRGFGGPQAMFCAENVIRHLAHNLDKCEVEVMQVNLFEEAQLTHFNQRLDNCNVRKYILINLIYK